MFRSRGDNIQIMVASMLILNHRTLILSIPVVQRPSTGLHNSFENIPSPHQIDVDEQLIKIRDNIRLS